MKKLKSVLFSLVLLSSFKVSNAFAQLGGGSVGVEDTDWFEEVFLWIIGLAGLVAVAVLIYNAFMYITAGGDEGKIQKSTKGITYAIVGLVIAAIAFVMVNFVIDAI